MSQSNKCSKSCDKGCKKCLILKLLKSLLVDISSINVLLNHINATTTATNGTVNTINSTVNTISATTSFINNTVGIINAVLNNTNSTVNAINSATTQSLTLDTNINNNVNTVLTTLNDIQKHTDMCTVILPSDFKDNNGILSKTYVISTSGNYCLGAEIDFNPLAPGSIIIQILADNVNLDLSGFAIKQVNAVTDVIGVEIGNSLGTALQNNIKITNGSLLNITGGGIMALNNIVNNTTVAFMSNFIFERLNILKCGIDNNATSGSAISLFSSTVSPDISVNGIPAGTPVAFMDVMITNCKMNQCFGPSTVRILTAQNVVFRDCQANELSSTAVVDVRNYRMSIRDLQMFNCQGNATTSTNNSNSANQCTGISLAGSVNVYIEKCQFNESFANGVGILSGANFSNTYNLMCVDTQFNNIRDGGTCANINSVHISDNTYQHTLADGIEFIDCQFNGNTIANTNPNAVIIAFVVVTARDIVFRNCQSANINTDKQGVTLVGFNINTYPEDPIPFYSNTQNILFDNCTITNYSASDDGLVVGITLSINEINRIGQQGLLNNCRISNCTFQHIKSNTSRSPVAAISAFPFVQASGMFPSSMAIVIENCTIADVRSNQNIISPFSSAISCVSTNKPVVVGNKITDCDRGILFSSAGGPGTTSNVPATLFQLASSAANALTSPPIFIDLSGISIVTGTATQNGTTVTGVTGGPFTSSPSMVGGTIDYGVTGAASQTNSTVTATSAVFTPDMVGDNITFPGYSPFIVSYINPTQVVVSTFLPTPLPLTSFKITQLIRTVTNSSTITVSNFKTITSPVPYTITYAVPTMSPNQTFTNTVAGRGGPVTITSSGAINLTRDTITSPVDLNFTGGVTMWQPGDTIVYNNGGGSNIGGLVSGNTYYLIVYQLGPTTNGTVQNNIVSFCTLQGYQDTQVPVTTSAWVNNTAIKNGTNYAITWNGPSTTWPIDLGSVSGPFPNPGNKYYNLSLQ